MIEHADSIVYDDRTHYVACVGEEREWLRWPAIEGGWKQRVRCRETAADGLPELPNGRLALRLSGALQ